MICFRDRTYCASPNCRNECGRQFTAEDAVAAKAWWGSDDYPVAMSTFCDKHGDLIRPEKAVVTNPATLATLNVDLTEGEDHD